VVYSLNRLEVFFHTSGTLGIHPAEVSPWEQHLNLKQVRLPCTSSIVSPPASRRLVYRRIVTYHQSFNQLNPTNTAHNVWVDKGFNPFPSPFTSYIGFTRNRRPILSWVFCAFATTSLRPKVDVKNHPLQQMVSFRVSRYLNGYLHLLPGFESPLMTFFNLEAFKIWARTLLVRNNLHDRHSPVNDEFRPN
jgi:hypothetical protein